MDEKERKIDESTIKKAAEMKDKTAAFRPSAEVLETLGNVTISDAVLENLGEAFTRPAFSGGSRPRPSQSTTDAENAEIKKLKDANRTLEVNLEKKTKEVEELNRKLKELEKAQQADSDTLSSKVASLMSENTQLQKTLDLQNKRLSASFTSQELSQYLSEAIEDFNDQMNRRSDVVRYSISNMEVDLKAQIVKQNDKLGFITTTEAGDAALSDIKISVAAVPNQ